MVLKHFPGRQRARLFLRLLRPLEAIAAQDRDQSATFEAVALLFDLRLQTFSVGTEYFDSGEEDLLAAEEMRARPNHARASTRAYGYNNNNNNNNEARKWTPVPPSKDPSVVDLDEKENSVLKDLIDIEEKEQ